MNSLSRRTIGLGMQVVALLAAGILLAASVPPIAFGQEAEGTKPAALTVPDLERLRKEAEATEGLDEKEKAKILKNYDKALEQLKLAADWQARAAAFEKACEEGPRQVETLQKELEKPLPEVEPKVPAGAGRTQLEERLLEVRKERDLARDGLAELENELKGLTERRRQVPELLAKARQRLREEQEKVEKAPVGEVPPELLKARLTLSKARMQALEAEIEGLGLELPGYEVQMKALTLRLDLAVRNLSVREKEVKGWQALVDTHRREEAEKAALEAREALLEATRASPEVRQFAESLAEENALWLEQRTGRDGLLGKMEATSRRVQETKENLDRIQANFEAVKKRVDAGGGLTAATGVLLRKNKAELPSLLPYKRGIRQRREEIEAVQVQTIELAEQRKAVSDLEGTVSEAMGGLDPNVPEYQRLRMERLLRQLVGTRRDTLESLLSDYRNYFDRLIELDTLEREMILTVEAFQAYIGERILWIRSSSPFSFSNLLGAWPAIEWMLLPTEWRKVVRALGSDLSDSALLYGFFVLLFVGWFIVRMKMRSRLEALNEEAAKPWCTSFGATAEALILTPLIAAFWPAVLAFVGWRLLRVGEAAGFSGSIGSALSFASVFLLTLEIGHRLFRPKGLGVVHFGWPADLLKDVHGLWKRLARVTVPTVFVVTVVQAQPDEAWKGTLGRLVFVFLMAFLAGFGHRMFRSARRRRGAERAGEGGWLGLRREGYALGVGRALAVGLPAVIGGVAMFGYYYGALQLSLRLFATLCFLLGVLVLNGTILRWMLIARRRLAIGEDRRRREALLAEREKREGESGEAAAKEEELDLAKVHVQSNRLVRVLIMITALLGIWMIWADLVAALGVLDRVELWHTTREVSSVVVDASGNTRVETRDQIVPVTLADLFLSVLVLIMTVAAARNLPALLGVMLLHRFHMPAGERAAITTIVQYAIAFTGGLLMFSALGIGWGNIQWLVAALGVGIGFGLQEIVANFISGLILLFERPIRVGDTVTVGDVSGTVSRIQIRATSITTWDRKELIVPNKEFVVGRLINWTLSDTVIRVTVPVGIAYGSDTKKAEALLLEVAGNNRKVLKDPAPAALFLGFGASSLDFELRAYTSYESMVELRHELHMAVDEAFRKAGIEIAFPQQDIHIRSVKDAFPLTARETDPKLEPGS
jgi:potassium efflux system protein